MPIETVAVVGSGAMGAMYAAHLASAGVRVLLVASGERAQRLSKDGLTVNGTPLEAEVCDVSGPGPHPIANLVLVAVKDRQLVEAVESVAPLVGPTTTFVSVLNGLDSEEAIAERYGPERVLLCIALGMDAQREGNAVAYRQAGRLVVGPMAPGQSAGPLGEVQDVLSRAGLEWSTPEDMRHEMWWKFMVNVGVNQASAVLRAGYGAFVDEGPARSLMLALCHEVIAVANAEGVALGEADLERWQRVLEGQPADGQTSMRQDVEAGRPTEVEIFAGRVVSLGERHGIPTPHNQTMLWILRALEAG
ncbi:ketopantoate reductase family protein [Actinomycetota bacterium]